MENPTVPVFLNLPSEADPGLSQIGGICSSGYSVSAAQQLSG